MSNPTRDEIMEHMAKAFFACAWADYQEEYCDGLPGMGVDVFDIMPDEIDPAATAAAVKLTSCLEKQHGRDLADIFHKAAGISQEHREGDHKRTPEFFGHYAAMGAMGHGVSLYDALGRTAAEWVNTSGCYMEFSAFDLDVAKYQIPENLED